MYELREYQKEAISKIYDWFYKNQGHLICVMPTGSGKSHIVAQLCKDAGKANVLMLTHQKELIEQNYEKLLNHYPDADVGIYSASVGSKNIRQITFAGVQSIYNRLDLIPKIDLIIIDECHLVNHRNEGQYREIIKHIEEMNENVKVIGLTATPFRLGHDGHLAKKTKKSAQTIWSGIINPVPIPMLIKNNHLSKISHKITEKQISVDGVKKKGGEFIEKDLQRKINTEQQNEDYVQEVIEKGQDKKAWLFFCCGVHHAQDIAKELNENNIPAACVTGKTKKDERRRLLNEFKRGELRALTNANVLTTGFDYPDIDLIVMLRPTESVSLYIQMLGRGMRPKSGENFCQVLDFAGNVMRHGPIDIVDKAMGESINKDEEEEEEKEPGNPPVKVCPECDEVLHAARKKCSVCGYVFPEIKRFFKLNQDGAILKQDLKNEIEIINIHQVIMMEHTSKKTGNKMLKAKFLPASITRKPLYKYFNLENEWALRSLESMTYLNRYQITYFSFINLPGKPDEFKYKELSDHLNKNNLIKPIESIEVSYVGEWPEVKKINFKKEEEKTTTEHDDRVRPASDVRQMDAPRNEPNPIFCNT